MRAVTIQEFFFVTQLLFLYIISRTAIQSLFEVFMGFLKSKKAAFSLISIFFLPGTVFHELAHFLAATILFIKVRDIKIFPHFEDDKIKLGTVTYEKKDPIRGIIIGIAPIFLGLFAFWFFAVFRLFPTGIWWQNLLMGYLIFVLSSTMFSSKQDLVDLVYVLPLAVVVIIVFYIFGIKIDITVANVATIRKFIDTLRYLNLFLLFSIAINVGIIILVKTLGKLFNK